MRWKQLDAALHLAVGADQVEIEVGPLVHEPGTADELVDEARALVAALSARNSRTSAGVGMRPVRSSITRRRNSWSVASGAWGIPSRCILPKICSSMKFRGVNRGAGGRRPAIPRSSGP